MSKSIQDMIHEFVIENFLYGDTSRNLTSSMSLIENDVIDSTAVLELVVFIEESFGIAVDDREIIPENLDSFDKIAAYVTSKMNEVTSSAGAASQAA